jgi:hypothetical protein
VVSPGRYVVGTGSLLIVCVSLGWAALVVRRRFAPTWADALARLAEAVIGFALLTALLEVLGTIRLFRLGPIVVGSVFIALGTTLALAGAGAGAGTDAGDGDARAARVSGAGVRSRPASTAAAVAACIAALAVLAEWSGPTFSSYDFGIRSFDSVWYHLPWAASFAQTGQITGLRFTDVEYLTAFYPATAEMFHGAGIVLLSRDTLSPIFNLVWLGLVLLAAYCVGRPRGLGWLTMVGAGVACSVPMFVGSQSGSAANDIVGIFFVLAAAAVFFNASDQRGDAARPPGDAVFPLVLGGVTAGLAIGTKLSMVIPALALTVGVVVLHRRRSWLWVGPLVVAGGFWYLRDLIAVGSPFPFVDLPGLATPAAPLQAHTGFSVAHYLWGGHAWSAYFQPGFASGLGGWWWAILALMALGPVLALLPGSDGRLRVLAWVALASIVGYLITPETAAGPAGEPLGFAFNLRYGTPALILSLTVLPLAPPLRDERAQVALLAVFGAVLVATLTQARLWPSRQLPGVFAVLAATLIVVALARRSPAAAGVAAALIVLVAGYPLQRHYLHGRYAFQPGVSSLARTWALFRVIRDARVGVVGTFGGFFSYPYFGLDVSNPVQYVGARGPHGSFTPIATCQAWRRTVNAGHFRYVVTTPARNPWHPKPLHASPEAAWTASDPAARRIYSRRAFGRQIAVFAIDGPLSPNGCRQPTRRATRAGPPGAPRS